MAAFCAHVNKRRRAVKYDGAKSTMCWSVLHRRAVLNVLLNSGNILLLLSLVAGAKKGAQKRDANDSVMVIITSVSPHSSY